MRMKRPALPCIPMLYTDSKPRYMAAQSTAAVMKATIWFCVSDEQKTPIAAKAPPSSSSPMYEPATLPVSMLPTGSPRAYTLK